MIIYDLPNEEYHNSKKYADYISSSQLKHYLKSPLAYKHALNNPQTDTDALRFGTLFHEAMALYKEHGTIDAFFDAIAIFQAPINPKTGSAYGSATKAYSEAYQAFMEENKGKLIATAEEAMLVDNMVRSLVQSNTFTSRQVKKLLKWGKTEVSMFHETEEGIKLKVRPDLLTPKKIVDWKTTSSDDLSEEAINRLILKYGYHISAAMYVWVNHELTGEWATFYLVIVSKVAPYDAIMVDMTNYAYRYLPDVDIAIPNCGAMEFKRLLNLHAKCLKENNWGGAETLIQGDKYKILEIEPPKWYNNKFNELTD